MEDTIAAIATPYGEGGIGIVRISGKSAGEILSRIFVPRAGMPRKPQELGTMGIGTLRHSNSTTEFENRTLTYGHIVDPKTGTLVDQVLVAFMKAPGTYTREDVVEINCHGGSVPLSGTLSLVLQNGARLAERGEFTKRAFLNGRIDLSQAEAVIDVIRAKTDRSFHVAMAQMEGKLSRQVGSLQEELMDLLVELAVNIDYPDEDIEEITCSEMEKRLEDIGEKVERLLATAAEGRILREGLRIAIAGKPNVGKSSLMNALLREARAIVTEIPGTTRDTIEEGWNLRGIPISLMDTAGIRETEDTIEKLGIERSKDAFNKADLILFVLDANRPLEEEDREIAEHIGERNVILLLNKADLEKNLGEEEIRRLLPKAAIIYTSMRSDFGLEALENEIEQMVCGGRVRQEESGIVSNVRHKDLLQQAREALEDGRQAAAAREALDLVEVDVRRAWEYLGEITGETVTEDIIDRVFERFCLGK